MANSLKGEVPLVLNDGRSFTLILDMEAMLSIEGATGKPLPQVLTEAGAGFFTATAAIAQAAFSRNHPEVTRANVLDMLVTDREALGDALGNATEAAFPPVSAEGNAPAPPKRPAGKRSGNSGAKRA